MKQTAVEWLEKEIFRNHKFLLQKVDCSRLQESIEQAKEMEKQQIIDCGNTCALMQYIHVDKVSQMSIEEVEKLAEEDNITFGEQYYNETFKSEQDNEQI
jgi:D-hexose-6-phosphate mutarotase